MNLLFKALNDTTRRQILDLLREGDLNAGDIAKRFDMSKPSISHHLDLLRQAGLVESIKQGQFITGEKVVYHTVRYGSRIGTHPFGGKAMIARKNNQMRVRKGWGFGLLN